MTFKHISKQFRINKQIKVPLVRLIDENDEQLGEFSLDEALKIATEKEMDLVEVAPLAKPPVCKILDFGKFLYRQKKIEQKHKRGQKRGETKGIRLSLRTDLHDIAIKAKQARGFIENGNTVKVALIMKGREVAFGDLAKEKLDKFYEQVKDIASIDQAPKKQGNQLVMILVPIK